MSWRLIHGIQKEISMLNLDTLKFHLLCFVFLGMLAMNIYAQIELHIADNRVEISNEKNLRGQTPFR